MFLLPFNFLFLPCLPLPCFFPSWLFQGRLPTMLPLRQHKVSSTPDTLVIPREALLPEPSFSGICSSTLGRSSHPLLATSVPWHQLTLFPDAHETPYHRGQAVRAVFVLYSKNCRGWESRAPCHSLLSWDSGSFYLLFLPPWYLSAKALDWYPLYIESPAPCRKVKSNGEGAEDKLLLGNEFCLLWVEISDFRLFLTYKNVKFMCLS